VVTENRGQRVQLQALINRGNEASGSINSGKFLNNWPIISFSGRSVLYAVNCVPK
jgi:hypothetical protein